MAGQIDDRVRRMVGRLSRAVPILIEAEFTAFVKLLESDTGLRALLTGLIAREQPSLEQFIQEFAIARPVEEHVRLHFADTLEKRAAFGFLVIKELLSHQYGNPGGSRYRFS